MSEASIDGGAASQNGMVHHSHKRGLRSLAMLEGAKGLLAIVGAIVVFTFAHKDLGDVADRLLHLLHVNPGSRFAEAVFRAADKATVQQIVLVGFGVLVYAAVRLVEAYGLWHEREWAEWFALLSGCLYLPWEIYEIARRVTPVRVSILVINVIVVIYLAWVLWQSWREKAVIVASG
ncbi:MAG: rane protein-like protein [Acidobacteriales bacterium]|nr:rane protein-like protein [Terriglobales bacterium]